MDTQFLTVNGGTLAFDDQAPIDKAIRQLEDVRTSLLKEMFAKDSKAKDKDKKDKG